MKTDRQTHEHPLEAHCLRKRLKYELVEGGDVLVADIQRDKCTVRVVAHYKRERHLLVFITSAGLHAEPAQAAEVAALCNRLNIDRSVGNFEVNPAGGPVTYRHASFLPDASPIAERLALRLMSYAICPWEAEAYTPLSSVLRDGVPERLAFESSNCGDAN